MNSIVTLPYEYYFDPDSSQPISNGTVYVGVPDLDPEIPANQLPVTLRQEDGTEVPIDQAVTPIRTGLGGGPEYNGSPVQVLVDGAYSIKVLDSLGSQKFYAANVTDGVPLTTGTGVPAVPFLADLIALDVTIVKQASVSGRTVAGDGYQGDFNFIPGNQAVNITSDQAIWVAPGSDPTGANGAWQRSYFGDIYLDWYVPDKTGALDVSAKITSAAAIGNVFISDGDYGMSASSTIPVGKKIICESRDVVFIPLVGASFTTDFMFLFNSTDGITWIDDYPALNIGGMYGGTFNNETNQIVDAKGCVGFGSYEFINIRSRYMYGTIKRPGAGIYSDNFKAHRIYAEPVLGTDFQIECAGLGDGLDIKGCHFPYNAANPGDGTPNGISVSGAIGGSINNCIGGNVTIDTATMSINNGHFEKGLVRIIDSDLKIENTMFGANTKIPIVLDSTGLNNYSLELDGCQFLYLDGTLEWSGSDIQTATRYNVYLKNCFRKWSKSGSLDKSILTGIVIENSSNVALTDFNNFSYWLSRAGTILPNQLVQKSFEFYGFSGTFAGITAASDSTVTWDEASGTYYYTSQVFLDTGRLVGRNQTNAESSIAETNGGNGVRLEILFGSRPITGIVRIYRGTSPGSYDSYVDLQCINVSRVYDTGTIVNGITWTSRVASAVETPNSVGEYGMAVRGVNTTFYAAVTTPTVGTWVVGDDIMSTAPIASGKRGATCTTAGTPGTWKEWGAIVA